MSGSEPCKSRQPRGATCSDLEESLVRSAICVLITFRGGGGWRIGVAAMLLACATRARRNSMPAIVSRCSTWNFLRGAQLVLAEPNFHFSSAITRLIDRISRASQVDGNDLQRLSSSRVEFDHRATEKSIGDQRNGFSPLAGARLTNRNRFRAAYERLSRIKTQCNR